MPSAPPLGLLLDVDGPLANPVTRRVPQPVLAALVALANGGVPMAFNTGRSADFVRDSIVKPLLAAGLRPDARLFGVCEKGAVWFGATPAHFDGVSVDESVAVPPLVVDGVRELFEAGYRDTMFWDEPKHAMVSLEQRTDVDARVFAEAQARVADEAFALLERLGVGVVLGERRSGDTVTFRIDLTPISVDVESVSLGKDLGADRALALIEASGPLPHVWRTLGDSRSDYAMADRLHGAGYEVAHLDVQPSRGVPERPYPVLTEGDRVDDAAGAAFLARTARELGLDPAG